MRLVLRATIILAVTIGLYVAADLAVGSFTAPVTTDASRVPAFRGQPYISPDFLAEAAREPGEWHKIDWTSLLAPSDYHGRYFNVDRLGPTNNLYRRTINPPVTKPKVTVLLLGPSTVYGPFVPDNLTLASLLSAGLNELDPAHSYVVYNAGVFAADSTQERDRLAYELHRGLKPDIVISFSGGIDILDGVYLARPGAPGPFLVAHSGLRGVLPLNIYHWLMARASATAEASRAKQAPEYLLTPARLADLTVATTTVWYDNQLAMSALSKAGGARFISILQPTPYSSAFDHPTHDIAYVHDLTDSGTFGLGAVAGSVQQALATESAALRQKGVEAIDLSSGFCHKTEDVFVDFGHLNAAGHRILAVEIAEMVLNPAAASMLQANLGP
jgi:lysophospholipase L1-like esterase